MKCRYCGKKCGFFDSYHVSCQEKIDAVVSRLNSIINDYNQGRLNGLQGKNLLIDKVKGEPLYKDYLWNNIVPQSSVNGNEVILYIEDRITVCEQKNRCKMVETGYRWEKMPVWNESLLKLANTARIIFTDKAIYLELNKNCMRYPYTKIVNVGFEKTFFKSNAYFDVKTSSPFPHRFYLSPYETNKVNKAENICLYLYCILGFRHE